MLYDRMRENAQRSAEQRDQQHLDWLNTGGLFEAIKHPELLKVPSERTSQEIMMIIQRDIDRKRNGEL